MRFLYPQAEGFSLIPIVSRLSGMLCNSSHADLALISVLAALGFLAGKEVKGEKVGNLGLQDRE